MLFIAITNWRRKLGALLRFALFLLLIGVVVPQLLNLLAARLAAPREQGAAPRGLRVELPLTRR